MAWPVDDLYQTFAALDVVTHDFLNAIQTAIKNVVGGSRSVKSLWADGVGDQASALGAGEIHAAGNIQSALSVISDEKMIVSRKRSSATPGSGQSVTATEIFAESSLFAFCRLKQTGVGTVSVTRSLNLASAPTNAVVGKYVFALQTAAPNGLTVVVGCNTAAPYVVGVRPASLTTSAFEVQLFDLTSTLSTPANNDELHVFVYAY